MYPPDRFNFDSFLRVCDLFAMTHEHKHQLLGWKNWSGELLHSFHCVSNDNNCKTRSVHNTLAERCKEAEEDREKTSKLSPSCWTFHDSSTSCWCKRKQLYSPHLGFSGPLPHHGDIPDHAKICVFACSCATRMEILGHMTTRLTQQQNTIYIETRETHTIFSAVICDTQGSKGTGLDFCYYRAKTSSTVWNQVEGERVWQEHLTLWESFTIRASNAFLDYTESTKQLRFVRGLTMTGYDNKLQRKHHITSHYRYMISKALKIDHWSLKKKNSVVHLLILEHKKSILNLEMFVYGI